MKVEASLHDAAGGASVAVAEAMALGNAMSGGEVEDILKQAVVQAIVDAYQVIFQRSFQGPVCKFGGVQDFILDGFDNFDRDEDKGQLTLRYSKRGGTCERTRFRLSLTSPFDATPVSFLPRCSAGTRCPASAEFLKIATGLPFARSKTFFGSRSSVMVAIYRMARRVLAFLRGEVWFKIYTSSRRMHGNCAV